jgi:hypothetical protein
MMMIMNFKGISLENLAIFVSDHLTRNGIDAVLTGGACVSIYSRNKYISSDLDFVLISFEKRDDLRKVMQSAGFYLEGGVFKHKDTPFFIEFLPPPASVGEEPVKEISIISKRGQSLRLLSPTDCIKDRLAAYYHWNDRQSLEQALLVGKAKPFDLEEIRRWSIKEKMADKFEVFRTGLKHKKRS